MRRQRRRPWARISYAERMRWEYVRICGHHRTLVALSPLAKRIALTLELVTVLGSNRRRDVQRRLRAEHERR